VIIVQKSSLSQRSYKLAAAQDAIIKVIDFIWGLTENLAAAQSSTCKLRAFTRFHPVRYKLLVCLARST
jgi:hypothetical protein